MDSEIDWTIVIAIIALIVSLVTVVINFYMDKLKRIDTLKKYRYSQLYSILKDIHQYRNNVLDNPKKFIHQEKALMYDSLIKDRLFFYADKYALAKPLMSESNLCEIKDLYDKAIELNSKGMTDSNDFKEAACAFENALVQRIQNQLKELLL
ncbi:MAG: hypothetical protein LBH62_06820 [Nitrososphaerota archaeon]|jgi:hypothetical protein|nr:hypothetical protein [Nitrososphaerota archaeon]